MAVSNYFPPEVNAPAVRTAEHAQEWTRSGCSVQVLTAVPNFPDGNLFTGYRNRLTFESAGEVAVARVPMYIAPNRGTIRRTLSYLSFMTSAAWHGPRRLARPDVVMATSPQFFAALGGWWVARRFRVPFVLEVRDLWPDSVVAVGAMEDSVLIKAFRRLESWLYRQADHIVVVTDAFEEDLVAKGVPRSKISVIKNGVDLGTFPVEVLERREQVRADLGVGGDALVASYIGTLGMAHRAQIMLDAAELAAASRSPSDASLRFLLVGTGAERPAIEAHLRERDPGNVILLDRQPRQRALELLAASDVSVVHLKDSPLFRSVIPSKVFEAMALARPIALGVDGEVRQIVEAAGAGSFFRPEDPQALLDTVRRLRDHPEERRRQGDAGRAHVAAHFDRRTLARDYLDIFEQVISKAGSTR